MRRLLPHPAEDIDVYDAVRPARRRWLRVNSVERLDVAVTDEEGRSGGLGGRGGGRLCTAGGLRHRP